MADAGINGVRTLAFYCECIMYVVDVVLRTPLSVCGIVVEDLDMYECM
jgi:hypothetical protein